MLVFKRIVIAQHERGLVIKDRSLTSVLEPGVYRMFDPFRRTRVEIHDLGQAEFSHAQAEAFAKTVPALMERHFQDVRLSDVEAGLVFENDVLIDVLPPATRRFYWKDAADIRVEVLNTTEQLEVPAHVLVRLARPREDLALVKARNRYVKVVEIEDSHVGMLEVDGQFVRTLPSGLYAYWTFNHIVRVEQVDQRLQSMDVQGQEILTRDKVSVRVNLSASYLVNDPVKARQSLDDFNAFLYRELQFGLRQAFGTRTLDALLENKGQLDQSIADYVADKALVHGLTVTGVGVKDLILPGEMRDLLNQVVEAEKVAQANVIKRREETAATRSLLNTAKLMDENPTIMRLKELEALEKVADKVDRLTVFGGLDGVLKDTVRIGVKAD